MPWLRLTQHVLPGSRPDGLWGWVMKKLPKDVMVCRSVKQIWRAFIALPHCFIETSISLNECD